MFLCNDEMTILRILHQINQKIQKNFSLLRFLNNFQISFFFIILTLRRRVANELLCSIDFNSFRKKIKKTDFENVKNITCSIFKLLETFIIINIKIR